MVVSITQSLQDSKIAEFSAEFRLGHGSAELLDLSLKTGEKPTFHGIGKDFHFLSAKFAFSKHRISIFDMEFAFSDSGILGGLFRAFFECKVCILWVQNFDFLAQNLLFFSRARNFHFLRAEFWRV